MDDLSEKLKGILNDPESMANLKNMADSLLSGDNGEGNENSGDMPPIENIGAIISIMSKLNSDGDNDRTRLLNALKPYLSEKRQAKTDNAIKILRLLELWPLIKESGMFNL